MPDRPVTLVLPRASREQRQVWRRRARQVWASPQAQALKLPVAFLRLLAEPPERRVATALVDHRQELQRAPPAHRVDRFALARSECRWSQPLPGPA